MLRHFGMKCISLLFVILGRSRDIYLCDRKLTCIYFILNVFRKDINGDKIWLVTSWKLSSQWADGFSKGFAILWTNFRHLTAGEREGVARLPEWWENKIWSWVPRDPETRITVLTKRARSCPCRHVRFHHSLYGRETTSHYLYFSHFMTARRSAGRNKNITSPAPMGT
jgi:hypothetical protein